MRIIVTHEQADFDALASLLGAYLLDENRLPVFPRRMNRNVKAFVTLYGEELPMVEQKDLPKEAVEAVLLVDTQTMATIRGVGAETRVHVVDHHQKRSDFPSAWTLVMEDVGATATLLVEQLREGDHSLSVVHASLLLLGIYEDTGSLTYSRTTPRDLQAASYLLEQGASLPLITDFLNHPLSNEQQSLYDRLREKLDTLTIHGHTVLIASGDAQGMDEELSTIAHKLRDLLDPDGLFLLVTTRGGVQMIARSTNDNIDVAELTAQFGGGGHSRAAASLIKGMTVAEVREKLMELLPRHIRPAVTVAEIMSRGAQVLGMNTPVQEAAERMQRYGYEGYPVVHNGRVVGLLTRRAVDRAIAHKLNLSAASLMNKGSISVQPGDSIEHLQRLMTDSGWGQVPVVNTESGEVIGIVTRTDLLKRLTPQPRRRGTVNLAGRLESALPPVRIALLKLVAEQAYEQHAALYMVGGFVRDLILERPSQDFDMVVEGDAIALANNLQKRYGGRLTAHARFGTAKWIISEVGEQLAGALGYPRGAGELPDFLDLITARTEFYTAPSALPTVERGNIKLDLHRRDFTINTLALQLDGSHYGELHDHWGGLNDLRDGLVRVLHSLSFVDDPTRILRAVRFEQRFNFKIEERTKELLQEAISLLGRVSGDRIRHELDHILDEENRLAMLERLEDLELMVAIHPALVLNEATLKRIQSGANGRRTGEMNGVINLNRPETFRKLLYTLWLLSLPVEQTRAVMGRLKYSSAQARDIYDACWLWWELPGLRRLNPSGVTARLEGLAQLAVYANYLASDNKHTRQMLHDYLTRWQKITPLTTGETLRSMGLPPGPAYKRILSQLRAAWLDGSVSSEAEERAWLEILLAAEKKAQETGSIKA